MTKRSEIASSDSADARLDELRKQLEQLQQELDTARAEIERLQQDTHRWWSVADKYRRELLSVYASSSWRMTWPLRQANLAVRQLAAAAWRLIRQILRLPRRSAKTLLLWSIRRVLARPRLRAGAESLLAHHPGLRQRLRVMNLAPMAWVAEAVTPVHPDVELRLSERAASIYAELRQALEARER